MTSLRRTSLIALAVAATAALLSPIGVTGQTPAQAATAATTGDGHPGPWYSGASGNGVTDGSFGTWRGESVQIAGTWSDDNANAANFWQFQKGGAYATWTKPVDVAVGAIDSGESWAKAATGAYDARWAASLKKLASLRTGKGTTYIRFAHEMNGNWYPWSVNKSNYKSFLTSWKRYRALQKKYFPAGKLVFSLNRESIGTGMDWRTFFPGKKYVDLVSVDYYNNYPYVATSAQWKSSLLQKDQWGAPKGLSKYVAFAKRMQLPLGISEWSGNASFGDSPAFVTGMLDYVKAHSGTGSGRIRYEILFDVPGYSDNFLLYGSGAKMPKSSSAYRAFFT